MTIQHKSQRRGFVDTTCREQLATSIRHARTQRGARSPPGHQPRRRNCNSDGAIVCQRLTHFSTRDERNANCEYFHARFKCNPSASLVRLARLWCENDGWYPFASSFKGPSSKSSFLVRGYLLFGLYVTCSLFGRRGEITRCIPCFFGHLFWRFCDEETIT